MVSTMSEKIAILIPAYNRDKYIAEAIISAQNQTYQNIEIIVYDDGSKDNTISIVEHFRAKDDRIHLIMGKPNRGVPFARNRLIEACTAKYACWLDSDDVSNIYRLEIQYEKIKNTNSVVYCRAHRFHHTANECLWKVKPGDPSSKTFQCHASAMFRVSDASRYNEDAITGGEDGMWIDTMAKEFPRIILPEVLYYVRVHSERIGAWKRRLRALPASDRKGKSYEQLIELYKSRKRE